MTDYTELLELLRYCSSKSGCIGCKLSEAYDCTADLTRDAAAAIEELLPKRGEWELIDEAEPMRWGCSRCKYLSWETSSYCPRCGAKMEVQE